MFLKTMNKKHINNYHFENNNISHKKHLTFLKFVIQYKHREKAINNKAF